MNQRHSSFLCHWVLLTFCWLAMSCSQNNNSGNSAEQGVTANSAGPCVHVYYDDHTLGRLYAKMVLNLLAHFPKYQRISSPISQYQSAGLEECQANLYIGSDYDAQIPSAFYQDYVATKKSVAWLGYSYWNLNQNLDDLFGYQHVDLESFDASGTSSDGVPGFFRDVLYKGETFAKFGKWSSASGGTFTGDPEVGRLQLMHGGRAQVLVTIRHSVTGEEIPWALQAGTKFLIPEVPLSYIHESDRYLVFCDLLFDLLGEGPQDKQRMALLRLEDIHSRVDLTLLDQAIAILQGLRVVPHLSTIPIFRDPLDRFVRVVGPFEETLDANAAFAADLLRIQKQGAVILWHGVSHQLGNAPNPFSGVSGEDFEFWDAINGRPVSGDSASWVRDRLQSGGTAFAKLNLAPSIWVTPHYAASHVDNKVFAQTFPWSIGRARYFDTQAAQTLPVSQGSANQFCPFPIFGDVYGQNVIPENLDHVFPASGGASGRSVSQILSDARRNLVLRDQWASVFYHPYLLQGQDPGATDLQQLVEGLQALGYQFVSLENYTKAHQLLRAQKVLDRGNLFLGD